MKGKGEGGGEGGRRVKNEVESKTAPNGKIEKSGNSSRGAGGTCVRIYNTQGDHKMASRQR